MSNYHTILFDLDHTLWDYESNSRTTLLELYHHYGLYTLGVDSPEDFISTFEKINRELWDQYDHGEIDRTYIKEKRFAFIFDMFSVRNNALALKISQEYIEACPRKGKLLPHAMATLEYLSSKYQLGLITNGFEDVQSTKLECAGIRNFFAEVVTSESTGWRKPSKEIFDYTLNLLNCTPEKALMIGDNLITDIGGARKARIDTAYYNPQEKPHTELVSYEINCLSKLQELI